MIYYVLIYYYIFYYYYLKFCLIDFFSIFDLKDFSFLTLFFFGDKAPKFFSIKLFLLIVLTIELLYFLYEFTFVL